MKFNFSVDITNSNGYGEYDFEEEILERATYTFIGQVLGTVWDDKSLAHKLEDRINSKVNEIMNKDFKDTVANIVTEKLVERFEKSKQYKELVKGNEIETDYAMKSGLKDMVAEVVKFEMRKVFK